ncbi:hypothetical protein ENUP19_0219G0022 [Entamoeba nuttalli]|uniref:Ras-GEF domain-containing protein n=2 Tax=Entamoeba nuttalli TaxID=412467 RepID=K2GRR4_ENTNP|nr:hypothetical protein ENU1_191240 [Entamoeba nuttalli P19]EKE37618.1 hypothetical protein ENU1_191240 [Entamoeba nuttalli P19]|eukprot:XP_008860046.1 hypothetical protein ENU1_191240 [Entamoeba nuttalli P19]
MSVPKGNNNQEVYLEPVSLTGPLSPSFKKRGRTFSQTRNASFDKKSSPLFLNEGINENESPRRRNTIKKLTDVIKISPVLKRNEIEPISLQETIPISVMDLAHEMIEEKDFNETLMEEDVLILLNKIIPKADFWKQTKGEKELKTKFGQVILKCYKHSIFFFEDETRCSKVKIPFDEQDIVNCRICVHAMEITHCELLRCFIKILKRIKDVNENNIQIICKIMISGGFMKTFGVDLFIKLGTFLELCKQKESDVFDLQSREPFYTLEGRSLIITHCSNEVMLQMIFSRIQQIGQFMEDYIAFTPYICDFQTTFENFIKILDGIEKDSKNVNVSKDWMIFGISRFEKMIICWINIMGNAIREECSYLFNRINAVIQRSSLLTTKFKKELPLLLKQYSQPRTSLSKLAPYDIKHVNQLFDEKRMSIVRTKNTLKNVKEINETIDSIKYYFTSMKTSFFTQQLIIFDQEVLSQVMKYDLYLHNEEGTLERYIKAMRCIEDIFIDITCNESTKKSIKKSIKIAKECFEESDFNMSYLVFSCLSSSFSQCSELWNKIEKKHIQTFEKLQEVYSISRNFNNYRISFENRAFPKVPILSLWMHDIVNINEQETFTDPQKRYLNLSKMRSLSSVLKLLHYSQTIKYEFHKDQRCVMTLMKLSDY